MAFCIDDASSTKCRYEIGNESEFHYLGISCFFRPIFCISFCNFFLALLFPLFRKASIQPSTDMKQILDSIALWSQAKCSQLPWVPVLFCALVPLPFASCRVEGTHLWWRHCCTEASGVMWLFPACWAWSLNFRQVATPCHFQSFWWLTPPDSVNNPVYWYEQPKWHFFSFRRRNKLWMVIFLTVWQVLQAMYNLSFTSSLSVTEPRRGSILGEPGAEHPLVLIQLEGTLESTSFLLFADT